MFSVLHGTYLFTYSNVCYVHMNNRAEADQPLTDGHSPCTIPPAVPFMGPGKQTRPKGKYFFPFPWSMSIGVSSLDFPVLNFKAFVKKGKKDKKTKLGT